MANLVYALNMSLDGYVDHDAFDPDPVLFRHFIDDVAGLAGSLYGRRMYEVMRYWDDEQDDWDDDQRAYAAAWRAMPKYVVSRTLDTVGPNATLVRDPVAEARRLKAAGDGVFEVAGPELAGSLIEAGLVDEVHLYVHPYVVGSGKRFFAVRPPRLTLQSHERIGSAVRLAYAVGDDQPD